MQRKSVFFISLFLLGSVLGGTEWVHGSGGETVPGIPLIPTVKNAPGTKLDGTLAVYYRPVQSDCLPQSCDLMVDMYFFLRLRKGNDLYPFSGVAPCMCFFDIPQQQASIRAFFLETVMPALFSDIPDGMRNEALALTTVDRLIQNDDAFPGECCNSMLFAILDVVIAVQE